MITVTLEDRSREWLGTLVPLAENSSVPTHSCAGGSVPAHSCAGVKWAIKPTPYGEAVLEALEAMPQLYPQVQIICKQLMPEHFHFILFVTEPLPKPLGALIRGFKAGAAKRWQLLAENGSTLLAENGEAQNSSVPAHSCAGGSPCWSDGFQDTILMHEGQLQAMICYLRENPARLAEKRANPDFFHRVASLAIPLDGGRLIGRFEALGNRHLLSRPLHQVQCSRRHFAYKRVPKPGGGMKIEHDANGEPKVERATPEYEACLADALAAGAHGAVVLSPCISDGERQIARESFLRKMPLVALRNMGFSPLQKPSGRYFEACAEGRLLMLAPAAWPYSTQEKTVTRSDATALNRICQWLAKEDAAEINYHGMAPANIDRLAMDAVIASKEDKRRVFQN